jgi:long-subunit acyl-CoA synthetase (AMP-forming)
MRMVLPQWVSAGARVLGSRQEAAPLEESVAAAVASLGGREWQGPVGLLADNSPHWIAADLAAHRAGVALVPLPAFFSAAQLAYAVESSGMSAVWCADAVAAAALGFTREVAGDFELRLFEREAPSGAVVAPGGASLQKITFTSGSTGTPKGVCLTGAEQLRTARALAEVLAPLGIARHLSLLPLAVLLENVAGVYTALVLGATCLCPPLAEAGMRGASGFDARSCLGAIARYAPDSVILLPQMLRALLVELERAGAPDPRVRSLKFAAVGGAKTPPEIIARARRVGLPLYEGYGLSECASVVALNVPGADRVGSVGRVLPGTQVRIGKDGEIEIAGRGFAGYVGAPAPAPGAWLETGDLGAIDGDGYLHVEGRKDHLLVTGYGRNVSPEWPESVLLASPAVAHACVFGEGRPHLVAVLAAAPGANDTGLRAAVEEANRQLPDYARIGGWTRAGEAFTPGNGLLTANGRVRRQTVWARYANVLNRLYESEPA